MNVMYSSKHIKRLCHHNTKKIYILNIYIYKNCCIISFNVYII